MDQSPSLKSMLKADPTECLTDAQLACVRLVGRGPSKVIAKLLGVSPHTVDNHLKAAMQRLGASTRHEAAEIIFRWEATRASPTAEPEHDQDLVSQSPELVPAADPAMFEGPWRSPTTNGGADRLREIPISLRDFGETGFVPNPSATGEGQRNGRSPIQIFALVIGFTVAIAITASAALPISEGFQALSNLIQPYHVR